MERLNKLIHPRNRLDLCARFIGFLGVFAIGNIIFELLFFERLLHDPAYYVLNAIMVGGPFTAFFSAIMVLQMNLNDKVTVLSQTDGLTGLKNRRTFLEIAEQAQQDGCEGALLLLDADNFKQINDVHGHQAGDCCLRSISATLSKNTRIDDVVGRVGGEEFAIFLPHSTTAVAREIGQRLTAPIPFIAKPDGKVLTVTLSVGAVLACKDKSLDELFAEADKALYMAKADGRARMVVWDDAKTSQSDAYMLH